MEIKMLLIRMMIKEFFVSFIFLKRKVQSNIRTFKSILFHMTMD